MHRLQNSINSPLKDLAQGKLLSSKIKVKQIFKGQYVEHTRILTYRIKRATCILLNLSPLGLLLLNGSGNWKNLFTLDGK